MYYLYTIIILLLNIIMYYYNTVIGMLAIGRTAVEQLNCLLLIYFVQ